MPEIRGVAKLHWTSGESGHPVKYVKMRQIIILSTLPMPNPHICSILPTIINFSRYNRRTSTNYKCQQLQRRIYIAFGFWIQSSPKRLVRGSDNCAYTAQTGYMVKCHVFPSFDINIGKWVDLQTFCNKFAPLGIVFCKLECTGV